MQEASLSKRKRKMEKLYLSDLQLNSDLNFKER
jgi:hypothetical protein